MPTVIEQIFKPFKAMNLIPQHGRLLLPMLLVALLINQQTRQLTISVLADAFWQVSVFVAATLALYHLVSAKIFASKRFKNLTLSNRNQVIFSSLMGAIPGCGGAIIVITQYVKGVASFGSVVAVLTTTMGDAAFLLFATRPATGFFVVAICVAVGIISGLIVNKLHGPDFLRAKTASVLPKDTNHQQPKLPAFRLKFQAKLWQWLIIPGAIISLLMAAQFNFDAIVATSASSLSFLGAMLGFSFIFLWAFTQDLNGFEAIVGEDKKNARSNIFQRVALDTNFVTSWVVVAFLCFELILFYTSLDLAQLFGNWPAIMPLIAVLIGMIPGCGPQIITTSLYLAGTIPLSAQLGNAISNDGDALFPAIALSPRLAIIATLYSCIPAIIVAYGYFILFEY